MVAEVINLCLRYLPLKGRLGHEGKGYEGEANEGNILWGASRTTPILTKEIL